MKGRPWPVQLFDPLSWAAGVFDIYGRFSVRALPDGTPYAATVRTRGPVSSKTGRMLKDALGAGDLGRTCFSVGADDQQAVLEKLLPRLRIQYDSAVKVLRFRLATLQPGQKLSEATKRDRRKLVEGEVEEQAVRNRRDDPPGFSAVQEATDDDCEPPGGWQGAK